MSTPPPNTHTHSQHTRTHTHTHTAHTHLQHTHTHTHTHIIQLPTPMGSMSWQARTEKSELSQVKVHAQRMHWVRSVLDSSEQIFNLEWCPSWWSWGGDFHARVWGIFEVSWGIANTLSSHLETSLASCRLDTHILNPDMCRDVLDKVRNWSIREQTQLWLNLVLKASYSSDVHAIRIVCT